MSNSVLSEAELKAQIDELRQEWDRLDNHGSQSATQTQIAGQLERLQKRLKDLTGEDY